MMCAMESGMKLNSESPTGTGAIDIDGARLFAFAQRDCLAQALACRIALALWETLDRAPQAYLMLSGGSTPVPMLRALSQQTLPWERVIVTLADERWVAPDQPESNTRMIHETLLQGPAAAAQWRGLYTGDATVETGCERLNAEIWTARDPDVLVLGMGDDGHTASLFPDLPELRQWSRADAPASLLVAHTAASPLPRISFSGRVLHRARHTLIHIQGENKRQVLASASRQSLPIAAFMRGAEVWWVP